MKTNIKPFQFKAFQVNEKFDRVNDLDFSGCLLMSNATGIVGTISIDIDGTGWTDFTGEHGFTNYVNDFGFIIEIEDTE
jgi:hypothetical protein